jgi:hypothetical protein
MPCSAFLPEVRGGEREDRDRREQERERTAISGRRTEEWVSGMGVMIFGLTRELR